MPERRETGQGYSEEGLIILHIPIMTVIHLACQCKGCLHNHIAFCSLRRLGVIDDGQRYSRTLLQCHLEEGQPSSIELH